MNREVTTQLRANESLQILQRIVANHQPGTRRNGQPGKPGRMLNGEVDQRFRVLQYIVDNRTIAPVGDLVQANLGVRIDAKWGRICQLCRLPAAKLS